MKNHFRKKYTFEDVSSILTLHHFSYILGESPQEISTLAQKRDQYYRPFIDDRQGKKRLIDQPVGALKRLHYKIKERILDYYSLSEAVHGAVPKHTPRDNAKMHLRQPVVVRLDLSDCFHSTKEQWVYSCFRKRFMYSHQIARLLTDLCTYKGYVPVGSPLSSILVNIIYDPLWRKVTAYCTGNGHTCTVWVDDIVISGPKSESLIPEVKLLINSHGLRIGWKKLKIQRNHKGEQVVTGCVVNTKLSIPKKKRREYAKTAILAISDSGLAGKLQGQLAALKFVNPDQGKQIAKLISKK